MKYLTVLCLLASATISGNAFAQGGTKPATPAPSPAAPSAASSAASSAPQSQPTPAPLSTIAAIVENQVSGYEKKIVEAAEAMPEDKFDFSPASLNIPNSAFKDVRTFAQLLKHTATANYNFWTKLTGEKVPENVKGPNGPDQLKTKAEIIQFLKDSFAVGHRAAKTLTAENATEQLPFYRATQPRLNIASGAVIHDADEYGQIVEYLRMNGIVPPASRGGN
ncbi:MAG TPA: DinB family protein [Candidatus Angelobacter sp.]|nr:DinB family protein [Candidatus Angelobacter sp.]